MAQQPQPPQGQAASLLGPLPEPIAVLPNYVAQQPTTLILSDKMFSFGDATIKDINGQGVFQIVGKAFSMSQRKEVLDMQGQNLFTIRKQLWAIPSSFYCEAPDGQRFLDVFGKWSFGSSKSELKFINSINQQPITIHLKENFFDSHAEIKLDNGHVICCIDRNVWSGRSMLGNAQTYQVTIAPGMDLALCVAMCVIMDERLKERRNR
ncbi:hypothetical protein MMC10_000152 [Thelotrema lepadinum]|nr:hypothetical protein [Thelotrema lepadinum]